MVLRRYVLRAGWPTMRDCVSRRLMASRNAVDAGKGNFFAFFNFPKQPEVDVAELQKRYHALQSRVHPDQAAVMASQDQRQGVDATDVSVYANSAYETLRDPFLRCKYLYRILLAQEDKGGEPLTSEEEENLLVEDDKKSMAQHRKSASDQLDEEFMVELMAMNELIFGSDLEDPNTRVRLEVLQYDLKERNADYYDRAKEAWHANDMETFKRLVLEWTYIHNAVGHLKQIL
ncbi:unnamed protein product [Phytomonas sp. EM1]|nr:unnamed protein product [Phytomonas sp. EM1]|eukprot:CCW64358.1 unnamed protein product [Phytomonas sp. isolate EM1]